MARRVKHPELLCCPNCGYDLKKPRVIQVGHLSLDVQGETYWKGALIPLTNSERLILAGIVGSAGRTATKSMLADRIDSEGTKILDVFVSHMRTKFREVDPAFNHLETVWGEGYRWNESPEAFRPKEGPKTLAYEMPGIPLKVYSNHEVLWQDRYVIYLTARQSELLKLLVDAQGDFVQSKDIWKPLGLKSHGAVGTLINALRHKFWEADERAQIIENWPGRGYAVVAPGYKRPVEAEVLFENEYIKLSHLEMLYKGRHRVHLSKRESQLLLLLAKANGKWVTNEEIYKKLKLENGYTTLKSLIHRGINRKIKEFIDEPVIEVMRGHGYRLFMERKRMPDRLYKNTGFDRRGELTMYVTEEVLWQGEHFIKLTPTQAKIMAALVEADGNYVGSANLMARIGAKDKAHVSGEIRRIRELFAKYDPNNAIIDAKNQWGYCLVQPVMEEDALAA